MPTWDRESGEVKYERYFMRMKLGAHWGYWRGSMTGGGSDALTMEFGMHFPELATQMDALLDLARARDYAVDATWFDALESYGSYRWEWLREQAESEPALNALLNQWTALRYGLDDVRDAAGAHAVLDSLCAKSDPAAPLD